MLTFNKRRASAAKHINQKREMVEISDFTLIMIPSYLSMTKNTFKTNIKTLSGLAVLILISPIFFIKLPESKHVSTLPVDKIFHFIFHGAFSAWFIFSKLKSSTTFLLMCSYGITVELLQSITDHRTFELLDIAANSLGVVFVLYIFELRNRLG